MKIYFSIIEQPVSRCGPKLYSEVEGIVSILVDGRRVFGEDGILLLELANQLSRWLTTSETQNAGDFCYESMDFEDSPIIKFKHHSNGWIISSAWENGEFFVLNKVLISAVSDFLKALKLDLSKLAYVDDLF